MMLPETDWTFREVLDAQAIDSGGQSSCEFCGTRIRWIHLLEHDEHPGAIAAGCCCATRLCLDYDAEATEREFKNRMARLARFTDLRRWRRSRKNPENICRVVRLKDRKLDVTVFLKFGSYGICIGGPKKDERCFHPERYGSQAEALNVAFELVERRKEGDAE
jgi:hypothetical protein